jgi:glucokinase
MTESFKVVADIGGTNIRLARVDHEQQLYAVKVYKCADFPSLEAVLAGYFTEQSLSAQQVSACLAIACPVEQDTVVMTNLPWQFSKSALKASLQLKELWLINDYTAVAHAISLLSAQQIVKIGGGTSQANKPISICGPGTGLGVANMVFDGENWLCLSGEGGHVDFAPIDEQELQILTFLMRRMPHVSYEQLLSGMGLENIYQALAKMQQRQVKPLTAEQISQNALTNQCDLCEQSLAQFCKILGSFAGNLALTLASFGGVYIAGGIVPRFIDYLQRSEFRSRFEQKGRVTALNRNIATYLITEAQPGLLGAAAYLSQKMTEEL